MLRTFAALAIAVCSVSSCSTIKEVVGGGAPCEGMDGSELETCASSWVSDRLDELCPQYRETPAPIPWDVADEVGGEHTPRAAAAARYTLGVECLGEPTMAEQVAADRADRAVLTPEEFAATLGDPNAWPGGVPWLFAVMSGDPVTNCRDPEGSWGVMRRVKAAYGDVLGATIRYDADWWLAERCDGSVPREVTP